jgi:hypothetical protein
VKTITVRLPEALVAQLDAESKAKRLSRSDVVRGRLKGDFPSKRVRGTFEAIADLIGSVAGLPADLSARRKATSQPAWPTRNSFE